MKTALERWLPVPGYPNYLISDRGRLMGSGRHRKGFSLIKPNKGNRGYFVVELYSGKPRGKRFRIHQLVLMAFCGPPPTIKHVGSHLDDVRTNNMIENLVWATSKENCEQAKKNKRYRTGSRHPMAKLSLEDRKYIVAHYWLIRSPKRKSNAKELAETFGVNQNTITNVIKAEALTALEESLK